MNNGITITLRETSKDPKTRTIPIGGTDGAKSASVKDVLDHWSKYHGSKDLSGMTVLIDNVEAAPDQIIKDGQQIRVARHVRAGSRPA